MRQQPALNRHRDLAIRLVTALFALVVSTLPLGHHDLSCHRTSVVHCTTCTTGLHDDGQSSGVPSTGVPLSLSGAVDEPRSTPAADGDPLDTPGRAPPADEAVPASRS